MATKPKTYLEKIYEKDNLNLPLVIGEYLSGIIEDADGEGLEITDEDLLQEYIDRTVKTGCKYLRNDIFLEDKINNLLVAFSAIEDLLTSDSNVLQPWQKEIQAVLDAKKELES